MGGQSEIGIETSLEGSSLTQLNSDMEPLPSSDHCMSKYGMFHALPCVNIYRSTVLDIQGNAT